MKKIKKLLASSRNNMIKVIAISLVIAVILIVAIGYVDSEIVEIISIVGLILLLYLDIVLIIFVIINVIKSVLTINRLKKYLGSEYLEIEDEEYERVNKTLYISKNIIIFNPINNPFVVHKNQVLACEQKEIFVANTFLPVIELATENKKYLIRYTMKKKADREVAYQKLKTVLNPDLFTQYDHVEEINTTENLNERPRVDFAEKRGGLNLFGFIAILVVLFILFGIGYYTLTDKQFDSPSNTQDTVTNGGQFRNVDFQDNGEIELTYDVIDDETVIYLFNNSDYAFKGKLTIRTADSVENIETYWMRPGGYDYVALKNKGEPNQYNMNVELYKELANPTDIQYLMYYSTLVDDYAFDIAIDDELTIDNVREIAIDQGIYSNLEDVETVTLLFHDMNINDFSTSTPPEDMSTIKYVAKIQVTTKDITIYEGYNEMKEVETFNYEEKYNER